MRPPAITDPQNVRVVIPLRVTWSQREDLRQEAEDKHISLNRLIMDYLDLS